MANTTINRETIMHLEWVRDNANRALSSYTNNGSVYGSVFNTLSTQGDGRLIAEYAVDMATFLLERIDSGWNTQNCKDYLSNNARMEWSSSAIGTALSAIKNKVSLNILSELMYIFDN